jgi:hypothetical protein
VTKFTAPAVAKSPSLHAADGLGDEEVQIGVALAVGVRAEVDRHAVDEQRDVGTMVGVEAAQEVLLGLAAAGVLANHQPGHEPDHVGRAPVRAQLEVLGRNQDLRRRRHRRWRLHHDRRHHGRRLRLGSGRSGRAQQHRCRHHRGRQPWHA